MQRELDALHVPCTPALVFDNDRARRVCMAGERGAQRPSSVSQRAIVTRRQLKAVIALRCSHLRRAGLASFCVQHRDIEVVVTMRSERGDPEQRSRDAAARGDGTRAERK